MTCYGSVVVVLVHARMIHLIRHAYKLDQGNGGAVLPAVAAAALSALSMSLSGSITSMTTTTYGQQGSGGVGWSLASSMCFSMVSVSFAFYDPAVVVQAVWLGRGLRGCRPKFARVP